MIDKFGCNILIIGGMGQGKTYYTKTNILNPCAGKMPLNIYDINDEYGAFPNAYKGSMFKPDDFITSVFRKKLQVNVFEEATYFLTHNSPDQRVTEILQRKRHLFNINVFIFTSVAAVPVWVVRMTDRVVLFNTADPNYNLKRFKEEPIFYEAIKRRVNLRPLQYISFNPNEIIDL